MPRPRIATNLKVIKGTAQPCRLNKNEPKTKRGIPEPPESLSEEARELWYPVARILDTMQVLCVEHGLFLEGFLETLVELRKARAVIEEHGATSYESTTQTGGTIWRPYPEVAQIAELDRRLHSWINSAGLTPEARSRVSAIGSDTQENNFAQFAS